MEFLNPAALYGFLALPLLLVPYLIRRRPRRFIISSLLLFIEVGSLPGGSPRGRLRVPPVFFLQLLLLALLILALSEPVFPVLPTRIAIVLDNSASMQTLENGKTRFILAKERSRALLANLNLTAEVALYVNTPKLQSLYAVPLTPSRAAEVLGTLEPYDLGDALVDHATILRQLAEGQKYERVYFITDRPAGGIAGKTRVISVGEPKANLALASFQVTRTSLADTQLEAAAEVVNYSAKDKSIKVVLKGAGKAISSRELVVGAGKSARAVFSGFSLYPYYEAEIAAPDALQIDNRRFATAPMGRNLRVLGISPRPQALGSLRSVPGVTIDLVSPREYEKTERTGYALEIFQFATPAILPKTPALFVLPPDANALGNLDKPMSHPTISSWREPHALTRYVNFTLFRPSYGRAVKPQMAGETIIESPLGALAFAAESHGVRYLILGFDPFPYLGAENLPMSIFTLNMLDWFLTQSGANAKATGETLFFNPAREGEVLATPGGDNVVLKAGQNNFAATLYQGIYQINRRGESELFAVNFHDANESDLRSPPPIELQSDRDSPAQGSVLFSYWPYLLLASLLLLLLEWFVNPRMNIVARRTRFGRTS